MYGDICLPADFWTNSPKQREHIATELLRDVKPYLPSPISGGRQPATDAHLPPWPPTPGDRPVHKCDVVIPYTAATTRWLAQSVESILNQNYVESIIHLICDGPPILDDPAEHLCSQFPQVHWYRNCKNVGPYISVHRVWRFMETEFVAVQDSDDIALPNRLWYSISALQQTGGDVLGAAMEQFTSCEATNEDLQQRLQNAPFIRSGVPWKLSPDGCIINGTLVCRREAFAKINGFLSLKCSADLEFPTRAKRAGLTVVIVPHVLALRRLHATSLSNGPEHRMGTAKREQAWTAIRDVYRQYDQPGVAYTQFGGLGRDQQSTDTLPVVADKITIRNLEYHVTHTCNMRCTSCSHYSNRGHAGHVTADEADREFALWSGRIRPKWLSLLGGEPTLNPALCGIIEVAAQHWRESILQLVTNGWFLHRHPDLPAVLATTGCRLEISIHGTSRDYQAKLASIQSLVAKWQAQYPIHVNWRESYSRWSERYHEAPGGIWPFRDDDPDRSWQACESKWCPQLFRRRLWKCPQIAYLSMGLDGATAAARDRWARHREYRPLSSRSSQEAVRRFLRRETEPVCEMCPARPAVLTKCNPLGRP